MQFVFNTLNHNEVGRRSLEDVIGILGHQLKALGHQAVYRHENDQLVGGDSGYNVIVEGFTKPVVEFMAKAHGMGARFIILATEEPTPKGFNWGTQKEMVWRQELFPEAAKWCDGILHLVPGKHVTDWYSQWAPTAEAELGYARTLVRGDRNIKPDYEFGFYGSLTPRRKAILKHLAAMCPVAQAVRLMVDFRTQEERDAEMQRAKVIIQVRKFEAMGLVSSSRCSTVITLGRPVVAEPHTLVEPWNKVISFPESMDSFYSQAFRARARWQQLAAEQLQRLKEHLSPERCIGQALDQLGILNKQKKAAA